MAPQTRRRAVTPTRLCKALSIILPSALISEEEGAKKREERGKMEAIQEEDPEGTMKIEVDICDDMGRKTGTLREVWKINQEVTGEEAESEDGVDTTIAVEGKVSAPLIGVLVSVAVVLLSLFLVGEYGADAVEIIESYRAVLQPPLRGFVWYR